MNDLRALPSLVCAERPQSLAGHAALAEASRQASPDSRRCRALFGEKRVVDAKTQSGRSDETSSRALQTRSA